jgi:3-mercaptopyruvate sulfurtransferase SseA
MSYVHPEVLVSTDWVLEHHQDPNIRIVEVSEDFLLYEQGHIPGSVKIDLQPRLKNWSAILASRATPPWFFMATRTTGGQPMLFGFLSTTDTKKLC